MNSSQQSSDFLLDWQSAELAAVEHLKSLGFIDAQKTQSGADGGIDVESSEAAAQVKFYASPVGRPDVQRLRGAAHGYRAAVFYSTGGYTKEAVQYADSASVALFIMDPYGNAEPHSELAELLVKPEMVQERREQLEELKAVRYGFALSSFEQDLRLFAQYVEQAPLDGEHAAFFSHLGPGLDLAVQSFAEAVEKRQFDTADLHFEEFNSRVVFLSKWIVHPELRPPYKNFHQAVLSGWRLESIPGPDYLQRIAIGAIELAELSELLTGTASLLIC